MLNNTVKKFFAFPIILLLTHFLGYSYAYFVRPIRAKYNPYLSTIDPPPPLVESYISYLQNLGIQISHQSGSQIEFGGLGNAAIASIGLLAVALVLSIIAGILIGFLSARHDPPSIRKGLSLISSVGFAMPGFFTGSLFFAGWFLYLIWKGPGSSPLLPFSGMGWDLHLVMPTLILMVRPTTQIAKMTATLLADQFSSQYVTAARSVGYSWARVRNVAVLKNILATITLTIASSSRFLVSELVVVEWIFDWPGIGTLFARTLIPTGITSTYSTIESVLFLDPGTVAATTMMFAALFLIIDWSAMAIARSVDPRLVG